MTIKNIRSQAPDLYIFDKLSPDFLDFPEDGGGTEELNCRGAEETGESREAGCLPQRPGAGIPSYLRRDPPTRKATFGGTPLSRPAPGRRQLLLERPEVSGQIVAAVRAKPGLNDHMPTHGFHFEGGEAARCDCSDGDAEVEGGAELLG